MYRIEYYTPERRVVQSAIYWKDFLKDTFPKSKIDLNNAASLMGNFSQGVSDVISDFQLGISVPVGIIYGTEESKVHSPACSTNELVLIKLSFLEMMSSFNLSDNLTLNNSFDGRQVNCINWEFFYLTGREEMHHIYHKKANPDYIPAILNPLSVSLGEYNAQDHEYASLLDRLSAARSRNFSQSSIISLCEMIEAAKKVRQK